MRSHLDYAAKQAYDIVIGLYGHHLSKVCDNMHHKFKSSERLTMVALHARHMGNGESATAYALQLEMMYKLIRPTASANTRERELASIFRHGIPKSLLDECNMYRYPKTVTETLHQVKHREKRWREKQNAANECSANVRNASVPHQVAYQAPNSNNNFWHNKRVHEIIDHIANHGSLHRLGAVPNAT